LSAPPSARTEAGDKAVRLAALAGLDLFPWQQLALRTALGERADGKWSAFESALLVPRQNGKGSVIEAYELANLFLFGARLIIHSAHLFPTAQEAFRRLDALIDETPALKAKVKHISRSHGLEGIELKDGARIRFMARTVSGSGRGFSPDRLVLDEAFRLPPEAVAAMLPALSAQPNPQILYTSSTGYPDSEMLWRLAQRGRAGDDASLAYLEWSAEPGSDHDDPVQWALSNPSMGYLFDEETVARERATLTDDDFSRERLGLWDESAQRTLFDLVRWDSLTDRGSEPVGEVWYGLDVDPDRSWASIGLAGFRGDGAMHVDVGEYRRGTQWLVARCAELNENYRPAGFVLDGAGPAGSLEQALRDAGCHVLVASAGDVADACAQMVDAVNDRGDVRHRGQNELTSAVAGAQKRDKGDGAFTLGRRLSTVSISPLYSVALPAWAARTVASTHPINNVW
jgi:hypothetical protein